MRTITVSDVIDYLQQFDGDAPVVLSMDDLGADVGDDEALTYISLSTMMEEFTQA